MNAKNPAVVQLLDKNDTAASSGLLARHINKRSWNCLFCHFLSVCIDLAAS